MSSWNYYNTNSMLRGIGVSEHIPSRSQSIEDKPQGKHLKAYCTSLKCTGNRDGLKKSFKEFTRSQTRCHDCGDSLLFQVCYH